MDTTPTTAFAPTPVVTVEQQVAQFVDAWRADERSNRRAAQTLARYANRQSNDWGFGLLAGPINDVDPEDIGCYSYIAARGWLDIQITGDQDNLSAHLVYPGPVDLDDDVFLNDRVTGPRGMPASTRDPHVMRITNTHACDTGNDDYELILDAVQMAYDVAAGYLWDGRNTSYAAALYAENENWVILRRGMHDSTFTAARASGNPFFVFESQPLPMPFGGPNPTGDE